MRWEVCRDVKTVALYRYHWAYQPKVLFKQSSNERTSTKYYCITFNDFLLSSQLDSLNQMLLAFLFIEDESLNLTVVEHLTVLLYFLEILI